MFFFFKSGVVLYKKEPIFCLQILNYRCSMILYKQESVVIKISLQL